MLSAVLTSTWLLLARMTLTLCMFTSSTGKPLVAHWTFNELGPTATIHEASGKAALAVEADRTLARTRGVHGNALSLSDSHALEAKIGPEIAELPAVTFSA